MFCIACKICGNSFTEVWNRSCKADSSDRIPVAKAGGLLSEDLFGCQTYGTDTAAHEAEAVGGLTGHTEAEEIQSFVAHALHGCGKISENFRVLWKIQFHFFCIGQFFLQIKINFGFGFFRFYFVFYGICHRFKF